MTLHYPAIEAVGIAAREPLAGLAFRPVSAQLPASNPVMSPSCLPAGKFVTKTSIAGRPLSIAGGGSVQLNGAAFQAEANRRSCV